MTARSGPGPYPAPGRPSPLPGRLDAATRTAARPRRASVDRCQSPANRRAQPAGGAYARRKAARPPAPRRRSARRTARRAAACAAGCCVSGVPVGMRLRARRRDGPGAVPRGSLSPSHPTPPPPLSLSLFSLSSPRKVTVHEEPLSHEQYLSAVTTRLVFLVFHSCRSLSCRSRSRSCIRAAFT